MHACDHQSDAAAGSHPHYGLLGGSFVPQEGIGRKPGALAYHPSFGWEPGLRSVCALDHSLDPEAGFAPGSWGHRGVQVQVQLSCWKPGQLDCCEVGTACGQGEGTDAAALGQGPGHTEAEVTCLQSEAKRTISTLADESIKSVKTLMTSVGNLQLSSEVCFTVCLLTLKMGKMT